MDTGCRESSRRISLALAQRVGKMIPNAQRVEKILQFLLVSFLCSLGSWFPSNLIAMGRRDGSSSYSNSNMGQQAPETLGKGNFLNGEAVVSREWGDHPWFFFFFNQRVITL